MVIKVIRSGPTDGESASTITTVVGGVHAATPSEDPADEHDFTHTNPAVAINLASSRKADST